MGMNILILVGGVLLLLVGGRLMVSASVDTARRLRISPLVVGLTLVAWGTSAPEFALNTVSAFKGRSDLSLGNIVGANICNLSLVLGACALIRPLVVTERLIRVEIWMNAAVLGLLAVAGTLFGLQPWLAALMLGVFGAYSVWTVMAALRKTEKAPSPAAADIIGPDPGHPGPPMSWLMIGTCFAGGLALLSAGGSFASDAASAIAIALGVPGVVVGVTIVSIGTTLPELVTGTMAVRRGQTDLAVGNALGSCLFNAGAIFGVTSLITPPAAPEGLTVALLFMGGLAIALVPISRTHNRTISRLEGAALLAAYAAFLAISALSVTRGRDGSASPETGLMMPAANTAVVECL